MGDFESSKSVLEYIRGQIEADAGRKSEVQRVGAIGCGYYSGLQYMRSLPRSSTFNGGVQRLEVNNNPDTGKIRVTSNRVNRYVQKAAVATFPEDLQINVAPPDHDAGLEATVRAQLYEDALNDMVQGGWLLPARRDANFFRGIWGDYGIGLRLRMSKRTLKVYGSEMELADSDAEFFPFCGVELTLDPFNLAHDLLRHDWVIHHSVWSVRKVRQWLGDLGEKIDEDKCGRVGDIAPFYQWMSSVTDGQIFAQYASNSDTKGVIVHQLHQKDERGRFSKMFLCVEGGGLKDEEACVNFDNPESPFGGSGLPFVWYRAHRRADGPYGLSDVAMMKDDQDQLNLAKTAYLRQQFRNAGWQWKYDVRSLPKGKSDGDFANAFSNVVGGSIPYDGGTKDDPHRPPELVQYPTPDSSLMQAAAQYEASMLEDVHRAQVNSGLVKSHTSDAVVQAAIEQSDQVLGARAIEDRDTDVELLTMALGTLIKMVKQMSPCTLGRLRRARFGPEELAQLYAADPSHIDATVSCTIHRYRSPNMRRAELKDGVVSKVIGPDKYRRAMVDLDMAVDDEDRYYQKRCSRMALRVLRGEPFQPIPLGEWNAWLISELRKAALDPICDKDPAARQRCLDAIASQEAVAAQQAAQAQAVASVGTGATALGGGSGDVGDQSFEQVMGALGAGPNAQPALAGAA